MRVLITGIGGFIGYHIAKLLLQQGHQVVGVDNFNSLVYDSSIKYERVKQLGFTNYDVKPLKNINFYKQHCIFNPNIKVYYGDISEKESIEYAFTSEEPFDLVIHLAAVANPRMPSRYYDSFISTNVVGAYNLFDCVRLYCPNARVIFPSTSSVYGNKSNKDIASKVNDATGDNLVSLYAVTKQCDETIAKFYSENFNITTIGLRFFTVYGPWGRPDMAMYKFTHAIIKETSLDLYNYGNNYRDFTYIDDLIKCINSIIQYPPKDKYCVYNIGPNNPTRVMDIIPIFEKLLNKKAYIDHCPPHPYDVETTNADMEKFKLDYGYIPNTPIERGIEKYIEWHRKYYNE